MNEVSDIVLFFGRFHPLVVHLPIGFLFFAFILEVFARWKHNTTITAAVPLALLLGAISALIACVLGYMLSLSGDYEEGTLDTHFWFGVATTGVAFIAWLISTGRLKIEVLKKGKPYIATLTLIVILLSVTGHYGGNLTHGSDYLTAYMPFGKEKKEEVMTVTSVAEATVFNHLVNPILQKKCASCHNSGKKKGGLSFEDMESIQKGGKSGPVFVVGDASVSEMIHRVMLAPTDEKFMPPEGKTPLTEEEIAILTYWITEGKADFDIKVGAVETPEQITQIAATILGLDTAGQQSAALANVPAAVTKILEELQASGFKIKELVAGSNLMDVVLPANTVGLDANTITSMLEQLVTINKNVIWLSLPSNGITDQHLKIIGGLENLKKLRLEKNPITDNGIAHLENLQNLEVLNVYETKITGNCIQSLSKIKGLKKVYIWGTGIKKEDVPVHNVDEVSFPELVLSY